LAAIRLASSLASRLLTSGGALVDKVKNNRARVANDEALVLVERSRRQQVRGDGMARIISGSAGGRTSATGRSGVGGLGVVDGPGITPAAAGPRADVLGAVPCGMASSALNPTVFSFG
jgi:hypothetical protein